MDEGKDNIKSAAEVVVEYLKYLSEKIKKGAYDKPIR